MHKSDDAARCIENEILMHLRKIKKHEQETSLNDQMGQDVEGGTLTLADILPSNDLPVDDQLAFKELTHHLYKWMHLLDDREAEIIQHRYGLFHYSPLTQVALAEKLGISRSYVSRIEKRALIKLYQVLKFKKIINRLKQNEISIFSRVRSREDTDFFNKESSIFSKYLSHKQF